MEQSPRCSPAAYIPAVVKHSCACAAAASCRPTGGAAGHRAGTPAACRAGCCNSCRHRHDWHLHPQLLLHSFQRLEAPLLLLPHGQHGGQHLGCRAAGARHSHQTDSGPLVHGFRVKSVQWRP